MELIKNNYIFIIIIGVFLIFALIGYIIDMLRNVNHEESKIEIPEEIKSIELNKVINNNINNNTENNPDDLLKNYEEDNKK